MPRLPAPWSAATVASVARDRRHDPPRLQSSDEILRVMVSFGAQDRYCLMQDARRRRKMQCTVTVAFADGVGVADVRACR